DLRGRHRTRERLSAGDAVRTKLRALDLRGREIVGVVGLPKPELEGIAVGTLDARFADRARFAARFDGKPRHRERDRDPHRRHRGYNWIAPSRDILRALVDRKRDTRRAECGMHGISWRLCRRAHGWIPLARELEELIEVRARRGLFS